MASLTTGLKAAGYEVDVVTAKPNYPRGEVFPGYEDGFFVEDCFEGCRVTRTWIWADTEKSFTGRALCYLSFVVFAVAALLRERRRYDVVVASSPPLSVGLAGWLAAGITRARFVFDVRDLWPDVAVVMGELPDGVAARLAEGLERFIYRRADAISTATESFRKDIRERVGSGTPVWKIPNGTVPERFTVETAHHQLRDELEFPDGFVATYAGNIGLAQGLELVLEAAAIVPDEEIHFLLVGEGSDRDRLRRQSESRGLDNVHFRDRVATDVAAKFMAASDALLVPLDDREIYRKFVPSKLYDCMAAGRPVLLCVDGEARQILDEAGAGIYCSPSDPSALVQAIDRLRRDEELAASLGRRGSAYVRNHYDRREIARDFADRLSTAFG